MLSTIAEHYQFYHPRLDHLVTQIKLVSDEISRFGSFNFILANNQLMIAYASTELYWTQWTKPQTRIALVDSDLELPLEMYEQGNTTIIVATKPLTKGDIWYPMGRGEIRLFHKGRMLYQRFEPRLSKSSQTLLTSNNQLTVV